MHTKKRIKKERKQQIIETKFDCCYFFEGKNGTTGIAVNLRKPAI